MASRVFLSEKCPGRRPEVNRKLPSPGAIPMARSGSSSKIFARNLRFLTTLSCLGVGSIACERAEGSSHHSAPEKNTEQSASTPDNAPVGPEIEPIEAATPDLDPSPGQEKRSSLAPTPETPPTDTLRVYAKSRHVWVRSMPTSKVQWIGYLWWGGSVPVRKVESVPGAGCKKDWVPIEPRGWVCVDDEQATLNPQDPQLLAIYPYRPRLDSPWPHKYAWIHAPLTKYQAPPDLKTQQQRERGFRSHFAEVKKARQAENIDNFPEFLGQLDPSLSGRQAPQLPELPRGLQETQTRLIGRSAITYVDEFDVDDRSFLMTGDLGWIPKDRVELLPPSKFVGVELGKDFHLPLAFFRGHERPSFAKNEEGEFEKQHETFARHAHVQLTGEIERRGRTTYYKVAGQDLWVSNTEAVIPTPRSKTPWGAPVGEPDTTNKARKGRATWIEASILGGWLVAFEGTTPKYATMISAGRGGTPVGDKDPLETASTPTGRFSIGGKFKTATMESSSTPIVHADVPWTQNFSGPYAIHSSYWHDDFGHLKSAGCVNVAPRDGKWLFEFTEPDVPDGWHGVRYVSRYGGGSTLFILHE